MRRNRATGTTIEVDTHHRQAREAVLLATGEWIASLAPWSHFFTLTHRLPGDTPPLESYYRRTLPARPLPNIPTYTRVGIQRHRRMVRKFFYDVIRPYDHAAQWWSEMEMTQAGVPHEHAMVALSPNAPVLSMRQWWYESCGYAVMETIEGSSITPAAYVAKYTEKGGAIPPLICGFGLNSRESHSLVLPGIVKRGAKR